MDYSRSLAYELRLHQLGGAILVVGFIHPPLDNDQGRHHQDAASETETEGPRERVRESGVIEVQTLSALVHDEEHCPSSCRQEQSRMHHSSFNGIKIISRRYSVASMGIIGAARRQRR